MNTTTNLDQKTFKTGFFGASDDVVEDGKVKGAMRETSGADEENESQEILPAPLLREALAKAEKPIEGKLYITHGALKEVTIEELTEIMLGDDIPIVIRGEIVKPKLKITF